MDHRPAEERAYCIVTWLHGIVAGAPEVTGAADWNKLDKG